jgi:UDP-N-acetylglucosamine 2-epimerase
MLRQVLDLFELEPDWNLDLMRPNQDLACLTGAILSGVDELPRAFRPDRASFRATRLKRLLGLWHPSTTRSR